MRRSNRVLSQITPVAKHNSDVFSLCWNFVGVSGLRHGTIEAVSSNLLALHCETGVFGSRDGLITVG